MRKNILTLAIRTGITHAKKQAVLLSPFQMGYSYTTHLKQYAN